MLYLSYLYEYNLQRRGDSPPSIHHTLPWLLHVEQKGFVLYIWRLFSPLPLIFCPTMMRSSTVVSSAIHWNSLCWGSIFGVFLSWLSAQQFVCPLPSQHARHPPGNPKFCRVGTSESARLSTSFMSWIVSKARLLFRKETLYAPLLLSMPSSVWWMDSITASSTDLPEQ